MLDVVHPEGKDKGKGKVDDDNDVVVCVSTYFVVVSSSCHVPTVSRKQYDRSLNTQRLVCTVYSFIIISIAIIIIIIPVIITIEQTIAQ